MVTSVVGVPGSIGTIINSFQRYSVWHGVGAALLVVIVVAYVMEILVEKIKDSATNLIGIVKENFTFVPFEKLGTKVKRNRIKNGYLDADYDFYGEQIIQYKRKIEIYTPAKNFEKESGCKLIKEPFELEHNSKKYLLIHGDSLCTDDINYQKLKKVLRNPIIQFIFLNLSKNMRLKLTGQLRKKSIEAQAYKSEKIMDINQNATDLLMSQYPGYDLIHGHTHRQNTHNDSNYTRHVLGDWSTQKGNAIKLDNKLEWLEIN